MDRHQWCWPQYTIPSAHLPSGSHFVHHASSGACWDQRSYYHATGRHETPVKASGTSQTEGDYTVAVGELIPSQNSIYEILGFLGRGTFGQVLKAWKRDTSEVVALKILKNIPTYARQGQREVGVLTKLSRVSSEECNFVRAYESFTHRGHICVVFELLQINLYDYLKKTRFRPLPLKHIRPIAQQVLSCLQKLKEMGLVHADLKPENIMLVDPDRQPFRVKVIDFGSATPRSDNSATTYLQSRYYRAPEVILGLPYNEAIDMWSLGCVLAELCLGYPLFPGSSEYDQTLYICQTVGQPPEHMLGVRSKACQFFVRDSHTGRWVLKSPQQYKAESGIRSQETRKYICHSLSDITQTGNHGNSYEEQLDCVQFVLLLSLMLTCDPAFRVTPTQALETQFVTMQHLAMHTSLHSVREWIQCMQVCCHSRTTASSPHVPPTTCHTSPQVAYHLGSSTLAYYPSVADTLHQSLRSDGLLPTISEKDTGYVSAESSPSAHVSVGGLEVPVFFPEPTLTSLLPHPLLHYPYMYSYPSSSLPPLAHAAFKSTVLPLSYPANRL